MPRPRRPTSPRRARFSPGCAPVSAPPCPLHRSPAYATAADLPHTDTAAEQVLSLPVHPGLTTAQMENVAQAMTALALAPARERAA
ncbi:DegT/DnrJ/EryC1/StrS family aminotransferase [Streptomyces sp. NPDC047917]|uniref:DegT/DnrJ/EryC1/StrS family aminotransferase n=1 Tax=Streptomyces sp. NPDC047917 TaxID=3365491 RepID=UPI003722A691